MAQQISRRALKAQNPIRNDHGGLAPCIPPATLGEPVSPEEQLRRLIDSLQAIVWEADTETGRFTFVSRYAETLLGYSLKQWMTQRRFWLKIIHPADRREAIRLYQDRAQSRHPESDQEVRLITAMGTILWVRTSITPVTEETGHQGGSHRFLRGFMVDITTQKRAALAREITAQISDARNAKGGLEGLLRFAHDQIGRVIDTDGFLVAMYDNTSDTYSIPYRTGTEFETYETHVPIRLDHTLTDLVRRTGRPLRADGAERRRLVQAGEIDAIGTAASTWLGAPLRLEGTVAGVIAVQVNQSNRIDAGEDLELLTGIADHLAVAISRTAEDEAQKRLLMAIDQAADSIAITDRAGVIQYANPAYEDITGYSRREILGQSSRMMESEHHDNQLYDDLRATLLRGDAWRGKLINKRKDGELFHSEATITPVRNTAGEIIGYVEVKRDITQQLALETRLRQAEKLESVGSLAAGIAHEINTPIQFVGDNMRFLSDSFTDILGVLEAAEGLVSTMSTHPELGPKTSEFAAAAEAVDLDYLKEEIPKAIRQTCDGVDRVATIVRAMKDFSHPDSGERELADLNKAITGTLTVARNELKYVADVVVDLDDELPSVWCHLGDLNQVFLNLLVNAAHAIADVVGPDGNEKGTITVKTRNQGEGVVISVSDTGTGIPPEIQDRIFEQFFTTKDVGHGTGQGLAIARSVIEEKHGGTLTFDTTPGKGTTFFVCLPVGSAKMEEAT